MVDTESAIKQFTKMVRDMVPLIRKNWLSVFSAKIGILAPQKEDVELINALLTLMRDSQSDFTNTFAALGTCKARDEFQEPEKFDLWEKRWMERIKDITEVEETLAASNSVLIPRNHRIEEMIQRAIVGDFSLFHKLTEAYSAPFIKQEIFEDLKRPPTDTEKVKATFCGT